MYKLVLSRLAKKTQPENQRKWNVTYHRPWLSVVYPSGEDILCQTLSDSLGRAEHIARTSRFYPPCSAGLLQGRLEYQQYTPTYPYPLWTVTKVQVVVW